jgi:hypothetical protein
MKQLSFMISLIFLVTTVSACTLTPSLVNQEPILAIPGESVK